MESVGSKACFLKNGLRLTGNDHIVFQVLFPFALLCACLSQCRFNRKDVTFRCFEKHYSVTLELTERKDLIFLLGEEAIQPVEHFKGCRSELLISELYPVTLRFNTKTEILSFDFDVVHLQERNGEQEYCKTSFQLIRNKQKEEILEKKEKGRKRK